MTPTAVKVDGKKIDEIIKNAGLTRSGASAKMGAGNSYLSGVITKGEMIPAYLKLFCHEFNVDESELTETPSKLLSSPVDYVAIDADKCRKLIYKGGLTQASICTSLGYENSWLSNVFSRGTMPIEKLKEFAKLIGVNWHSLVIPEDDSNDVVETVTDDNQTVTGVAPCNAEYIKCVYNLATAIEAALTGFRQDLLAIEGVSDEQV